MRMISSKRAATSLYNTFVKAESWLAFNSPVMMFVIYASIIALHGLRHIL